MNPFLMFLIAILSPILLAMTLLVPPYVGITAASYIIYDTGAAVHPLAGKLYDVFYIIDVYTKLFSQWSHHITETSVLSYALPLLLLPIFGIMFSMWSTGFIARKLKDIFHHNMSY